MRTAAGVLDTGNFVLERIREQPRRRRENDDLVLTARGGAGEAGTVLDASGLEAVLDDVGVAERDAFVWYWLRHVDWMIQEPGHANNPRWFKNNVMAVATTIHVGEKR